MTSYLLDDTCLLVWVGCLLVICFFGLSACLVYLLFWLPACLVISLLYYLLVWLPPCFIICMLCYLLVLLTACLVTSLFYYIFGLLSICFLIYLYTCLLPGCFATFLLPATCLLCSVFVMRMEERTEGRKGGQKREGKGGDRKGG